MFVFVLSIASVMKETFERVLWDVARCELKREEGISGRRTRWHLYNRATGASTMERRE